MMVAVQSAALMVWFVFMSQVVLQLRFNDAIGQKENVVFTKYPPEAFGMFEEEENVECVSAIGRLTEARLYGSKGICNADLLDIHHTGLMALNLDMVAGDDHFAADDSVGVLIPASMALMLYETTDVVGEEMRWRKKGVLTTAHVERIAGVYKDLPPNCELSNVAYRLERDIDSTYALTLDYYLRIRNMGSLRTEGTVHYDSFRKLGENAVSMKGMFTGKDNRGYLSHIMLATLMFSGFVIIIAALGCLCISMGEAPSMMKKYNTLMVLGTTKGSIRWDIMARRVMMSFTAFMIAVVGLACIERWKVTDAIAVYRFYVGHVPLWMTGLMLVLALATGIISGIYPAYYTTHQPLTVVTRSRYAVSGTGRAMRRVMVCAMWCMTSSIVTYAAMTGQMTVLAICSGLLTVMSIGAVMVIERKYRLHSLEIMRILGMTIGELLWMQLREHVWLMVIGALAGMVVAKTFFLT